MFNRKEIFKEFLNFVWLRPENALLSTLRSESLYQTYFEKFGNKQVNSIDVSCGDGQFAFCTFGGKLDVDSDAFLSVDNSQKRSSKFDTYDFFDKKKYKIKIKKKPFINFKTGTDWKKNLLEKSRKLKFYNNLIHHDNNYPLPIKNRVYDFTYSNSSYWVKNFEKHINDLVRITKKNGFIVLEMKMREDVKKLLSVNLDTNLFGKKFSKIINAGRLETWKGLSTRKNIEKIINSINNCAIHDVKPIYGSYVAKFWAIGYRPMFKPLATMVNNIDIKTRRKVKTEWCEIIFNMFSKFLENYKVNKKETVEWSIILKKT